MRIEDFAIEVTQDHIAHTHFITLHHSKSGYSTILNTNMLQYVYVRLVEDEFEQPLLVIHSGTNSVDRYLISITNTINFSGNYHYKVNKTLVQEELSKADEVKYSLLQTLNPTHNIDGNLYTLKPFYVGEYFFIDALYRSFVRLENTFFLDKNRDILSQIRYNDPTHPVIAEADAYETWILLIKNNKKTEA